MKKLSRRMKRMLAVVLVEVIVATNVFVSYADESEDDGVIVQMTEEEADDYAAEVAASESDNSGENGEVYEDTSNESSADEVIDEMNEPQGGETSENGTTEDGTVPEETPADGTDETAAPTPTEGTDAAKVPTENTDDEEKCTCDALCTVDAYDEECPVCAKAADIEDKEEKAALLADCCKAEEADAEETPSETPSATPTATAEAEITVTAVCQSAGEVIEGTESLTLTVKNIDELLEKAPEIDGYEFTKTVTLEDGTALTEETLVKDAKVVFEYTKTEEEQEDETADAVTFTAKAVDQDGETIEGYASRKLSFEDSLDLTRAPFTIEGYTYKEATIDGTTATSLNKAESTSEEGEATTSYFYTLEGDMVVEVTENTTVTLVYEAEEKEAAEITLAIVDEDGNAIEGYAEAELPEFTDSLALDNPEKAPIAIEGYVYKEAAVDGTVITELTKTADEEDADASVISYITEDGESVAVEEDITITLTYSDEKVVAVDASVIDTFGDPIADKYTGMDLGKIFDDKDELVLDDPENAPVDKVQVRKFIFKVTKYTYVKATIGNEIISGLKREATSATKDLSAKEQEYIYSYTTDGSTWTKIKEDTTVYFEYTDGKKSVFTYEDDQVSVTATLQHAGAIPDDAEFVVTPVTEGTSGYNYDAYMEALNANADAISDEASGSDAKKYTEENTLLYDIAFLAPATDEDGNVDESTMIEYQPTEGMVNISITFKNSQISEDLGAEAAGDVTVVHLPLEDSVKESTATTADATDISAGDIKVEVVSAATSLSGSTDLVDYSMSDFSITAFTIKNGNRVYTPGTSVDYKSVLGTAVNYGLTAENLILGGHMDTNFAVKAISGSVNTTAGQYTGNHNPGNFIIASVADGAWFTDTVDGKTSILYTTAEAAAKFNSNIYSKHVVIDTTYSEAELNSQVDALINAVKSNSATLAAEKNAYSARVTEKETEWTEKETGGIITYGTDQKYYIDLTHSSAGTYYVSFTTGEYATYLGSSDKLRIKMNSDQNIVFNIPDEGTVDLYQFKVSIDGTDNYVLSDLQTADADKYAQKVIFNIPSASVVNIRSSVLGVFLCPNAHFSIGPTSTGWLVAKTVKNSGEWHGVWQNMPETNYDPATYSLAATKTVDGVAATADQTFSFKLEKPNDDNTWTTVETKNNAGGTVSFSNFTFDKEGTYYYRVSEVMGSDTTYTYDETQYIAKIEVKATTTTTGVNSSMTKYTVDSVATYKASEAKDAVAANATESITFNNETNEGSLEFTKTFDGHNVTEEDLENITFTVTGPNNYSETFKLGDLTKGSDGLYSKTLTGLALGDYTVTETGAVASGYNVVTTYKVGGAETNTASVTKNTTAKVEIKNSYEQQKGSLKFTKTLAGDTITEEDKTSITFTVTNLDTNEVVGTYTLGKMTRIHDNKYEQTIENLAPGNYQVVETNSAVEGYNVTVNYGVGNGKTTVTDKSVAEVNITDTYEKQAGKLTFTKTIAGDTITEDDLKDISFTVTNLDTGVEVGTYTLGEIKNTDGTYKKTIENLAPGKYQVVENNAEVEGYNVAVTYDVTDGKTTVADKGEAVVNITNKYEKQKGSLKFTKTIAGDTITPEDLVNISFTVTGPNNYSHTFKLGELTKDSNGVYSKTLENLETGNYTVVENNAEVVGYQVEVTYGVNDNTTTVEDKQTAQVDITNKYTREKTSITVNKKWEDNDNQDGVRPESIKVTLLKNGVEIKNATVTADAKGNWSYTFDDLVKYEGGKLVTYTVTEEAVSGYSATVSALDTSDNSYTITNTHTPGKTAVSVQKAWVDNENQDGKRPESIQVQLYADGTESGSPVTLNESNNWSYTWSGLAEKKSGKTIAYTVDEVSTPDGYTKTVSGSGTSFIIKNSHNTEKTAVYVNKVWDDNNNQDGKRPTSITINLYADGKQVGSKTISSTTGDWSCSFTGLDKYANGKEIVYTVDEAESADLTAAGYTKADEITGKGTQTNPYVITNSHKAEKTSITANKVWDDANNQDGKRPTSITVNLLKNGTTIKTETIQADASGNWSYTFKDLDKYENGAEITYTVTENTVTDYTTSISDLEDDTYTITNSYKPGETAITVQKVWSDNDNQDGKRPTEIQVQLYADNVAKGDAITLNAENGWKYEWTGLAKMNAGKAITYTVKEVSELPDGYTSSTVQNGTAFTITNSYDPEETEIHAQKVWEDSNNQDGKRPTSVTINLYADGEQIDSKTVTSTDNWSVTFDKLPKYANGTEIKYTVDEVVTDKMTADGYTKSGTIGGDGTKDKPYTITNSRTTEKTRITVQKEWNDANNQDGKRPTSITVNLLKNGEAFKAQTITADENGNWSYTFDNLDKYANGSEITYTVTENEVTDYTTSIGKLVGDAYTITNSYKPGETAVTVQKVWSDSENQDGKRPTEIQVQLYANDVAQGDVVILSAANNWKYEWTGLAKMSAGEEITYTVDEVSVPTGYVKNVTQNGTTFTITNSHDPEETVVYAQKVWNDSENQDGKRPAEITINLYADGSFKTSKTVTSDANGSWSVTFDQLPKYANGTEIKYTVDEVVTEEMTADGYTKSAEITGTGTAEDPFTITNNYDPEKTSVTINKVWDANGYTAADELDARPKSITVNLYANGEKVDEAKITADENGNWTYTFKDLDKYAGGKLIDYTVSEEKVSDYTIGTTDYTKTFDANTNTYTYTITNHYTPGTTGASVQKIWVDNDNQDNIRPDEIKVTLYSHWLLSKTEIETVTLDESNNWSYSWTGLVSSKALVPVTYTVEEEAVEGYETTVERNEKSNESIITNTHDPEIVELAGQKTWEDNDNQDGLRPESIIVTLYTVAADGTETPAMIEGVITQLTVTPDEDGNWSYKFENLPKYDKGVEIVYTVKEEAVEGYETTYVTTETGVDIKNAHDPEAIEIEGTKTWNDSDNQDGVRPESIIVSLYANGAEEPVDQKTVTEADNWSYKFTDLPKYENGVEIVYTVKEEAVEGYSTTYDGYDITNSYTPGVTSRTVWKYWANVDDTSRPSSATVQLYANGEAYGDPVVLTAEGNWTYTWTDLPEKSAGDTIVYTVVELNVANGYTPSYSEDTFTITNTRTTTPTPTPSSETPTPSSDTPTPSSTTPADGGTPTPSIPTDEVLGARRVEDNAVLGARRGSDYAVLGKRRRPQTGDSLALLGWAIAMAAGAGAATTSVVMLKQSKKKEQ